MFGEGDTHRHMRAELGRGCHVALKRGCGRTNTYICNEKNILLPTSLCLQVLELFWSDRQNRWSSWEIKSSFSFGALALATRAIGRFFSPNSA